MNERDVMALLAEANPVRVAELPPFEATLPASVFARRKPQRHLGSRPWSSQPSPRV